MIEFNQLEHLVAIAKNKTISKAAEELLISQPGLTRSMQRLEDDLGLSLFDRKKNKIELNENGKLAVEFAQKLLAKREEMIKELTKLSQNHISFGSCAPAPLWGVEYALSNNIEAQIESTLVQDENILIEGLEKGDYSLIVLHHPLQDKKYISQEFLNESLYLSVPPAHPLAPFKEISFSDLNGQSVLLLSRIGFWNEVCQRMIPESHLLFQDDPSVFNELTKMSALPNFRSDITIQIEVATVLMVTHDSNAASYCKRILFIQDGVIFHELRRDLLAETQQQFYERILQVMAQLGGGSANVL